MTENELQAFTMIQELRARVEKLHDENIELFEVVTLGVKASMSDADKPEFLTRAVALVDSK